MLHLFCFAVDNDNHPIGWKTDSLGVTYGMFQQSADPNLSYDMRLNEGNNCK